MARTFVIWAVLAPAAALAQLDLRLGAEVYARTCANQYCHGAAGEQGAAAALAGRKLRYSFVARSVIYGIANTNMPPWKEALPPAELDAVIEYVMSLQSAPSSAGPAPAAAPEARRLRHPGRALFFDPGRVGSCGSCHEFQGLGTAVAPLIEAVPGGVAGLRAARPARVDTVALESGATFPGVKVDGKGGQARYYDLRPRLPVLRTLRRDRVPALEGSSWTHAAALDRYSLAEQETIIEYLRLALR